MEQLTLKLPEPITVERISYLINKKGIDRTIANIDLEMVKMKLRDTDEGLGWTDEQCAIAEIEYKRFLHLNKRFPDFPIVPHRIMDLMWHQHILDTRAYHKDSRKVFGKYFHHFPYFGIRGESDRQELNSAFDETQSIYAKVFGEEMIQEDSGNCKKACKPHTCKGTGSCSNRYVSASKCTRNCVSRCKRACKT